MKRILNLILSIALLSTILAAESDPPSRTKGQIHNLFTTAESCMACHNGLVTSTGEDVSIGFNWRPSMMANAARDPYWHAGVRREITDHPKAQALIENECSACHMPMSRFHSKASGQLEGVFSHLPDLQHGDENDELAADGTSCTLCHQIDNSGFGTRESFVAGFSIDTNLSMGDRMIYGPYLVDSGRSRIMQSFSLFQPEQSTHVQESELCATCHTLFTHSLDSNGEVVGELPEQVPYLEWRHSSYRNLQSCQDCHMEKVSEQMKVSSVWGEPRDDFSRHSFRGGNFFMPRVFNRYRDQLKVKALSTELDSATRQTLEHLKTETAKIKFGEISLTARDLKVQVQMKSYAGHKLPTAYPSRRVWIHFVVKDGQGNLVFESGNFRDNGSIQGNDNDSDPNRFEPHYEVIDSPDQVQIYEPILGGPDDSVTTGLLTATQYLKDNRILPLGFDKQNADADIAVRGKAFQDRDFAAGGDSIIYSVPVDQSKGPYEISAEAWYQPIGYRWAQNLGEYNSEEPQRFVRYYNSLSKVSATILAQTTKTVNQ